MLKETLSTNKYALVVEIDTSLFEVFDIVYLEQGSEIDLRYNNGTLSPAIGVRPKNKSNIKVGSFWDGQNFVSQETNGFVNINSDQDAYVFISDSKMFGIVVKLKEDPDNDKYQAAFESNVLLINASSETSIGLGDLWDGQKVKSIV
jgi:hypothetical protein